MNVCALLYPSLLLLLLSTQMSKASIEPVIGTENGLVSFSKDGQRISRFALSLDPESGLDSGNHEPIVSNGKTMKTHLLAQQEIPLLIADHYARLPYGKLSSKYLLKPIRELSVANSLFSRGEELGTSRARRYAYPLSSQSFLRFGRRFQKRPKDAKDTAFLRFGRSELGNQQEQQENSPEENGFA